MMSITLNAAPTNRRSLKSAPEHNVESLKPIPEFTSVASRSDSDSGRLEPLDSAIAMDHSQPPRPLRPLRFAFGMLLTGCGMAMILLIAIRLIEVRLMGGDFSTSWVAVGVLTGILLLGGGFGIMASSSSGFDEDEFDRLAEAGNISATESLLDTFSPTPDAEVSTLVTQTRRPA